MRAAVRLPLVLLGGIKSQDGITQAMAAGFEVAADRVEALKDFIDGRIGDHLQGEPPRAVLELDGERVGALLRSDSLP